MIAATEPARSSPFSAPLAMALNRRNQVQT
jgi:hypothetical protein